MPTLPSSVPVPVLASCVLLACHHPTSSVLTFTRRAPHSPVSPYIRFGAFPSHTVPRYIRSRPDATLLTTYFRYASSRHGGRLLPKTRRLHPHGYSIWTSPRRLVFVLAATAHPMATPAPS
ncbi:hypothetical protein MSAN_00282400 [Mycena sanguinolenta]|uniref:Uncharacterized protein n=1 Tax=Mycena sanguinolenta TaxID=230812 RepID=A0A8H7DH11_9AGAR|nr:hypothetical protein MSAN_00282400 [Mycena sanguinolenta]